MNAAAIETSKSFSDLIYSIVKLIVSLGVPIIFTLALLVFLYGVYRFIASAENEDKRKEGKDFMLYGIIGLFVMISVWGLVRILTNTFNVQFGIPQLKTNQTQQNNLPTSR